MYNCTHTPYQSQHRCSLVARPVPCRSSSESRAAAEQQRSSSRAGAEQPCQTTQAVNKPSGMIRWLFSGTRTGLCHYWIIKASSPDYLTRIISFHA